MEDEECSVDLQCLEDDGVLMKREVVINFDGGDEEHPTSSSQRLHNATATAETIQDVCSTTTTKSKSHMTIEEVKQGVMDEEKSAVNTKNKNQSKSCLCATCGFVSTSWSNLKKHLMIHSNERPYKCRRCFKAFRQRHHLVDHWRIHTGESAFKCDKCDKQFVQKSSLNVHKKKHLGIMPFACVVCDYATYHKVHLKIHMRVHTGEKPHQCEICGQTFSTIFRLKSHRMIHTGEKPYSCDQCNMQFREKVTLQTHRAVHIKVGPFVCEECGQEFSRLAGLSLHRRVHANKDSYLYVYKKEKNRVMKSAAEKALQKVNLLKKKLPQLSETADGMSGTGTEDAEVDDPPDKIPMQEAAKPVTPESKGARAIPAEAYAVMRSLTESNVAPNNKCPLECFIESDQHKLKESLASSLQHNEQNSNVNPEQVKAALARGTVLETQSNNGKDFFIVLPPGLQNRDVIVLSDPSELARAAAIRATSTDLSDSILTQEDRDTSPHALSKHVIVKDKVPFASVEEGVQVCAMDSGGMEEDFFSDGETEMVIVHEADPINCSSKLSSSSSTEMVGLTYEYWDGVEKSLPPDGKLLLQSKNSSKSKGKRVTYVIEDGKDPVIVEEECRDEFLEDNEPAGGVKIPSPKGSHKTKITIKSSKDPEKMTLLRDYKCGECGKYCKTLSRYSTHMRIHTGEKPYCCSICQASFRQLSHLKSHRRIHKAEKPYACDLCSSAFKESYRLKVHKEKIHPNGLVKEKKAKPIPGKRVQNFFCRFCNKTFIGECLKIDHMKQHQSLLLFVCKVCGMQFRSRSTMLYHLKKHSDFKQICELCGAELITLDDLQRHKAAEHAVNTLNTDMCIKVKLGAQEDFLVLNPAMGNGKHELSTNIRAEIPDKSNRALCEIKEEEEMSHVNHNNNEFNRVEEVNATNSNVEDEVHHAAILSSPEKGGKNPSETDQSNMVMTTSVEGSNSHNNKVEDEVHHAVILSSPEKGSKNTSEADKSNTVPVMTSTTSVEGLDSHDNIREILREGEVKDKKFVAYINTTGKKVWVCKVCNHSFTQSSNLYCHMRLHTGDKPYVCNVCPKAFRQIAHLKDHMRRHTKAKPYQCSLCSKGFTQRSAARRHIKIMHGGKAVAERIPESQLAKDIIDTLSNDRISKKKQKAALIRNDGNISHMCKVCKKIYTDYICFVRHSRRCGKSKNWKSSTGEKTCDKCGDNFASHTMLSKHQKHCGLVQDKANNVETKEGAYKKRVTRRMNCEKGKEENEKGENNSTIPSSKNTHKSFPCRVCDEVLSSIASLKTHMEGHNCEVENLCMLCGEVFRRASALRYHQYMKHNSVDRRYKDYYSTITNMSKKKNPKEEMEETEVHTMESESEYEYAGVSWSSDDEGVESHLKVSSIAKKKDNPEVMQKTRKRNISKTKSKSQEVTKDIKATRKAKNETYDCSKCEATFTHFSKLKKYVTSGCQGQHATRNGRRSVTRKVANHNESLQNNRSEKESDSLDAVQKSKEHEINIVPAADINAENGELSDTKLECKDSSDEGSSNRKKDNNKPFKCKYCALSFRLKSHLHSHYRRHITLAGIELL